MERNSNRVPNPVASVVAANIHRLRTGRGWTTRVLAERLTGMGWPFSHSGVTRTEKELREVKAADLMAFAAVFDVSPVALLLPVGGETADLTPGVRVPLALAWSWAFGETPREGADTGGAPDEIRWRYRTEGLPVFRRDAGDGLVRKDVPAGSRQPLAKNA